VTTAAQQTTRLRCGECTMALPLDEHMVVASAEVAVFVAAHQHSGVMSITLELGSPLPPP
jgi:hypothetical protein